MDDDEIDVAVQEMIADMELRESGILLKRIGNRIQLCTNPKYAEHLKELFAPTVTEALTQSVLETLSIIAYRQPVTRAEIDETRGVHSNYTVSALIEKGLVEEIGHKDVLGRPALLGTTDEFLRHFGIASLNELPQIDFSAGEEEPPEEEEEDFPI
jgi:segregation and condensation protein B